MSESTEAQPQSTDSALPRRYEIDALRSIALFLLIVYHVFIAFQPAAPSVMFIGFSNSLENVWFFGELLNSWRIPVLFLISGITAGYLLQNRPVGKLLSDRLMRLVPPLLFTTLFIGPISPALYQIFQGEELFYIPNPSHLWFVMNLVVYLVLGVPLLLYLKNRPNNVVVRLLRTLSPYGWLFILPAFLTLTTWGLEPHIDSGMFSMHFMRFWNGFACFLSGVVLVSLGDSFWQGIRKVCHLALPAALALCLMRITEVDFGSRLTGLLARTTESAYAMLAFLGYGSLAFSRPSRLFRVLNRSVFPVYIIHMPVQQAVAFFLIRLEMNVWLAFGLHLAGTLSVSALIYIVLLRPMRWLHPFFGIAPLERERSQATNTVEMTPPERPWPVMVGRIATLYVVSPLLVIMMMGSVFLSTILMSIFSDRSSPVSETVLRQTTERFQGEIASRSTEENYSEVQGLIASLGGAIEEGDMSRAMILSLEVRLITEALENEGEADPNRSEEPTQERNDADQDSRQLVERVREESASRSPEENRRVAEGLIESLRAMIASKDAGRARDLAVELETIIEETSSDRGDDDPDQ